MGKLRMSRHNDGGRVHNILRAMGEFAHTTADERRADPAPYADSDEQRAQIAVGLVAHFAPRAQPGHTLAETFIAGLDAEIAELRLAMRDADGRVCCCACGTPYSDAEWCAWYGEPDLMPEPEDLLCATCAFGEGA